jgi:hypothetical protein
VDKEQSHRWLSFGDIKAETGSGEVAVHDQALSTNCYKKKYSERRN